MAFLTRCRRDFAGYRAIFGIENFLFQKRIPFIAPGKITPWTTKHQDFVKYNSDVISAVSYASGGRHGCKALSAELPRH